MPIEIRELTIKVTVDQPNPQAQPSGTNDQNGGKSEDKDALVAQCVDQILSILNSKKER
ncbi:MAG TPA: DUF5908 family protein [Mucilaginibacter sp.]|nr:DUF5908 family protein [Mucilaginibacter sp.]